MVKLKRFISIKSLDPFFSAPKLRNPALHIDLNEAVSARVVRIPHEDVVDFIVYYLLRRRIPKDAGVVGCALLACHLQDCQQSSDKQYRMF